MFKKLKLEYKSNILSNIGWGSIPIPIHRELKNSPIYL